jgi:hypothetical protein
MSKFDFSPDAIRYIVNDYMMKRQSDGLSVIVGISQRDVETVLDSLVGWAAAKGYLVDDILKIPNGD